MTNPIPRASIINDDATREAMREVIAERGKAVDVQDRERYPDSPDMWINYYGWQDHNALWHKRDIGCAWVVPTGVSVNEINYSQFEGTDCDSSDEHGLLAYGGAENPIHCACGKFNDVVLMYRGTLSELIHATLKKLNPNLQDEDDLKGGFQL